MLNDIYPHKIYQQILVKMTKMKEFKELAHSPTASKRFIWNLNPGNINFRNHVLSHHPPRLPGEGHLTVSRRIGLSLSPHYCTLPNILLGVLLALLNLISSITVTLEGCVLSPSEAEEAGDVKFLSQSHTIGEPGLFSMLVWL